MIVPALRSAILPTTAWVQKKRTVAVHLELEIEILFADIDERLLRYAPALLISTEIGPSSRSTVSTAATTARGATSVGVTTALPPGLRINSAVSSSCDLVRAISPKA